MWKIHFILVGHMNIPILNCPEELYIKFHLSEAPREPNPQNSPRIFSVLHGKSSKNGTKSPQNLLSGVMSLEDPGTASSQGCLAHPDPQTHCQNQTLPSATALRQLPLPHLLKINYI